MSTELNDVKLQLQKISYEGKESAINVESLKETNQDLQTELEELRKSLEEMRTAQKVNVDEEKIKRKADKMAEMMAGFDPSVSIAVYMLLILEHHNNVLINDTTLLFYYRARFLKRRNRFAMLCINST